MMSVYEECNGNPFLMLFEADDVCQVTTYCEKCHKPKVFNVYDKKDRPDLDGRFICKKCRQEEVENA